MTRLRIAAWVVLATSCTVIIGAGSVEAFTPRCMLDLGAPEHLKLSVLVGQPGAIAIARSTDDHVGGAESLLTLQRTGEYTALRVVRLFRGAMPVEQRVRYPLDDCGGYRDWDIVIANGRHYVGDLTIDVDPAIVARSDPPRLLPSTGPQRNNRVRHFVVPTALLVLATWLTVTSVRLPTGERDPEDYGHLAR